MTVPTAAQALAAAATLGPFSAVAGVPGPGWVTWAALVDGGPLERRVVDVRAALAAGPGSPDVDLRVAASLAHLGLVARLVSPLLGAALTSGVLPVAPPSGVHLRLAGRNPLPLTLPSAQAVPVADSAALAAALDRCWLAPAVLPLSAAVAVRTGLSRSVLDGNAVSAVAGALRMAAAARPELVGPAAAALDEVLFHGALAGTGRRRDDGSFVRRSCCLLYRLPSAGTCGDCILA
ncbi:(2Fe-2S)-binding protein [Blastococcus mobilis]|uniref:(2Fe-2S)-binding protein n=1 Tax=Blastococcus mobilis TaxID=1938746 RepID=UPI001132068E|nr:(2Fe-2S)-binding protein [Blastococcus mobilis]